MKLTIQQPKHVPILDPGFLPAVLWNRSYQDLVSNSDKAESLDIALHRPDGTCSIQKLKILPYTNDTSEINNRYIERLVKFMLWQKGGFRLQLTNPKAAAFIQEAYSTTGSRSFDYSFLGDKIYGQQFSVEYCAFSDMPVEHEISQPLGRHLDGCRIGFDLGGSDRKCAAVKDGKVVYSEEVEWHPYFESDPAYHLAGIRDTLKRAASKLPRVDAIGGSAAGVYVDSEIRAASLFRGISEETFQTTIRPLFHDLQKEWNVPFDVVNDGEVTALAGSMSLNTNAVLGISMGTSVAAGYVTPEGNITPWLNELAFVPVDYREDAPVDEWAGDNGCAVQYFCQQGVARLAGVAGIDYAADMPLADRLIDVQQRLKSGDSRAAEIFKTIGTCFGYTIAHFSDFYDFQNLLFLGRVTSGEGGALILEEAKQVLADEFPDIHNTLSITVPDEHMKRHGQAVAAASLPSLTQ